jgi:hypothetical protein
VVIRDQKGFYGGCLLILFSAATMFVGRDYRIGTTFRMGPGYFPIVLSSLLMLIGIIVTSGSIRSSHKTVLPRFFWRPLIVVSIAVGLFGLMISSAGITLSTFVTVFLSRFSRPGYPWPETIILSVVLTALCSVVFYYGLKVQIPLLPVWWG